MQQELLLFFDNYLKIGLNPILLQHGTKKPILKNWNKSYYPQMWRNILETSSYQNFNLAILLGKIVDVEGDTPEANELLCSLIGDYPHPCFRSYRSTHHLFLNPDPTLSVDRFYDIEFRANKVCSVMPPSIHESGFKYKFLKESQFPIPPMPFELRNFYLTNRKQNEKIKLKNVNVPRIKKYHTKTLCKNCGKHQFIHKKRLKLEVAAFISNGLLWMCRNCRTIDIRNICRIIRFDSKKH